MNFIKSIKFRFTLWYLAILGLILVFLGFGIYYTLSKKLFKNMDNTLEQRALQICQFQDVISIVASGTFEEEPGELLSFFFYNSGKLIDISHGNNKIPIDSAWVDSIFAKRRGFHDLQTSSHGHVRLFAMVYIPQNPNINLNMFDNRQQPISAPPRETQEPTTGDNPRFQPDNRLPRQEFREQNPPPPPPRQDQPGGHTGDNRPKNDFHRQNPPPPPPIQDQRPRQDDGSRLQFAPPNKYHSESGQNLPEPPPAPPAVQNLIPSDTFIEIPKAVLVVGRSVDELENVLDNYLYILLIALPLTLSLAGVGGLFLLNRALIPVDQITRTARKIEETDLSRRINITSEDELGQLAATLNRMIERLEKAFLRQKELTGDASHELRAPLAVIKAEATLALQKNRDLKSYKDCIEVITHEADHMEYILKQLLTLARADFGKTSLRLDKINLNEVLAAICDDIRILCSEKKLSMGFKSHEDIKINGDVKALRNLFLNLLTNAIRYTPEGGKISVELTQVHGNAVVSVSDTGIGIPLDALPHIFKRFFRVDKARSRKDGGSGLGLAICKHIIDQHNGRIMVESELGRGTKFIVRIPVTSS
ncbi:MAG: HAMP domain-containing histidine kinase [Desulfobacteraceae bacterium]|nr:HAMP domain-containing histidine kinase [Desulfobacteraceae bacterium]